MYQETSEKIYTYLKNNWTETFIDWESYGKEGEMPVEPGESFIRPSIDWVDRSGKVGGMGKQIGAGYVLVEIYTPYGEGRLRADRYADTITDLFKTYRDGPLDFTRRPPTPPSTIGQRETNFYHINVQLNFEYHECREEV